MTDAIIQALIPEPTEAEYDAAQALCGPSETFVVMQSDALAEREAVLRVASFRAGIMWAADAMDECARYALDKQGKTFSPGEYLRGALIDHDLAVAIQDDGTSIASVDGVRARREYEAALAERKAKGLPLSQWEAEPEKGND